MEKMFENRNKSGQLINPIADIIENIIEDYYYPHSQAYTDISELILKFANEVRTSNGEFTQEDLEWFLESIKNK